MVQILGFSLFRPPGRFRGHFEEIGIAKGLLGTSHVVWKSFGDVGFPTSEKVWREKKIKKIKKTLRKI